MPSPTHSPRSSSSSINALWLAGALALGAIAGCQTQPSKPQTEQAKQEPASACMERCALANTQCSKRQDQREQECQAHAQPPTATSDNCEAGSYGRCLEPVPCLGPDERICEVQNAECLRACEQTAAPSEPHRPEAAATAKEGAKAP